MLNNKSISPVVATALLIVVSVGAVIGFQNFFQSYSSSIFSDVEGENSVEKSLRVEGIFSDILYLNSGDDTNLSILKIVDSSGNEMCTFSGTDEVNSTGLVGLWKLNDENSTIEDLSGNGNNGRLYGNTRLLLDFNDGTATDQSAYNNSGTMQNGINCSQTAISGSGCLLDGVDDYISFNFNENWLNTSNSISVSTWVNPIELSDESDEIIFVADSFKYGFTYHLDNKFYAYIKNGAYNVRYTVPELDRWYHLVETYDGYSLKFYIDNVLIGQTNVSVNLTNQSTALHLGYPTVKLNGSIDEVAIYSKALTEDEIADLYNSQRAKFIEFKSSKLDKFVEFDGVDDYIDLPSLGTSIDQNNDSKSIFFIFNKNSFNTSSPSKTILSNGNGNVTNIFKSHLQLGFPYYRGNGVYYNGVEMQEAQLDHTGSKVLNTLYPNRVYTGVVSSDGLGNISFYLNYQDVGLNYIYDANTVTEGVGDGGLYALSQDDWTIGASTGYYSLTSFDGQIDEIRIYNRTLSNEEINTLYFYSFKPLDEGVNEIDISSCNLVYGEYYDVVAFTDKNKVEMKVIAK